MRKLLWANLGCLLLTMSLQAKEFIWDRDSNPLLGLRRTHHHSSYSSPNFISVPGPMGLPGQPGAQGPIGAAGATGATGATGAAGASGSFPISYASSYDDAFSSPLPTFEGVSFSFPNVPPVGIIITTTPADGTIFTVQNSGIYHITWTLLVGNSAFSNTVSLRLRNPQTDFIYNTKPTFQQLFIPGIATLQTISGQTTVNLSANDQVQLQISTNGGSSATSRTFTITQIAPAP